MERRGVVGVHLRETNHKDEVGRDMEISLWWWDPLWFAG